jgi:2,3-bisphosphoglycerate-dependent phosphoglycerate mutase
MPMQSPLPPRQMILVRHGATEPNLAGLRCGGDLDVPLTALGREQARQAALRIRELGLPVGVIVASHLQRTRETAAIIGEALGCTEVVIEPGFAERRLGEWNLCTVAQTEAELLAGVTPPGGESNAALFERIVQATRVHILPRLRQRPLLVGSKGVARALREMLGMPGDTGLANGELLCFDLRPLDRRTRAQAQGPSHAIAHAHAHAPAHV